jgi:deoxyribodipyrimidine photo-lyase
VRPERSFVLYWMIAARRTRSNFALERAATLAEELGRPLVVFEAIRAGHRWASRRFLQFVVDGMRDNRAALAASPGVTYFPYIERRAGDGRGLLAALAADAASVVTDEFPCFFLPRMVTAAAAALDVRVEAVDGNGLLPIRAVPSVSPTAYAFRRVLQRMLPVHLAERPATDPLAGRRLPSASRLDPAITARWPHALEWLATTGSLDEVCVDHGVAPTSLAGGAVAASARLEAFLRDDLPRYREWRNSPDHDVASRLSPYLHWGHIGVHDVFDRLTTREGWMGNLPRRGTGAREGWWGLSAAAEAFLDELVTWRELGFNRTARVADYDRFESLPAWATRTLERHAVDERTHRYTLHEFEEARTHDPLWNAAQRQLRREGRIHNYLRMLWGKKILEWTASPREAVDVMIELNNKYALDGRDPNSYTGIFWVLGRYDRPWAPERPIFGVVRYMSSENTARKLKVKQYLARFGAEASP